MAVDIKKKKKKKKKNQKTNKKIPIIIIILSAFSLLVIMFLLLIPKIYLTGHKNVELTYGNAYQEEGYKAKFLFMDITNKVHINNKVNNRHIGSYTID